MTSDLPVTPTEPAETPDSAFSPQQLRVIDLIANGATITEAAATLSIHRNTIGNWRRYVPDFAHELELAVSEQVLYWHEQAVMLAPKALDILRTIMHNDQASNSLKLRAATLILKMAGNKPATNKPATNKPALVHKPAQSPAATKTQDEQDEINMAALFPPLPDIFQRSAPQPIRKSPEPGRNSICPCGSNTKYKRCCGNPAAGI